MNRDKTFSSKITLLLAALVFSLTVISGCGFNSPLPLQHRIRVFFYENQEKAETKFVNWAKNNLSEYSNETIMNALVEEGKYHASQGHPNAISVISVAAKNWAKETHLRYSIKDWQKLHQQAVSNLRDEPGELEIWPK